ncbi:helix-turn-helix domain-containing protein [Burkholderia perseverans]|uniref:helix-turn-helix domain-containing protein n=1 Tax=Burkholderia perseverans TaxID=2615214 RepID=UPI001FED5973|nr:helix-turn-helix transcriptional regulator [Burkholderia perseverans]
MTQLNWLDMLRTAVAASTRADVAKRLGYSRTAVSQALSGTYAGKTDRIATRVLEVFGQVQCTHTGQLIELTVCVSYTTRRAPINNPLELSHWRTCRNCPLRPDSKGDQQ